MTPAEKAFPEFVAGLYKGLYTAMLTDPDVFLMATASILLGGRRRARGAGLATCLYVVLRRLDQYIDVGIQVAHLSRLNGQRPTSEQNCTNH